MAGSAKKLSFLAIFCSAACARLLVHVRFPLTDPLIDEAIFSQIASFFQERHWELVRRFDRKLRRRRRAKLISEFLALRKVRTPTPQNLLNRFWGVAGGGLEVAVDKEATACRPAYLVYGA